MRANLSLNRIEQNRLEQNRIDQTRLEQNRMEWNGMEWNGIEQNRIEQKLYLRVKPCSLGKSRTYLGTQNNNILKLKLKKSNSTVKN